MRRGRLFLLLGLVLIVLVAAVAILLPRLTGGGATTGEVVAPQFTPTPTPEPVNVIITTQRIGRAEIISEDVIALVSVDKDNPMASLLITDLREAIGKRSKFDLDAGIFLTPNMLVNSIEQLSSEGSEAALQIPDGMLAVSIPISRLSAVSYGLRKGDHVNVIMTVQMVDVDSEFQTLLPNRTSALIAPGPSLVGGEGTVTSNELLQILTAQVIAGGSVSPIGRLELNDSVGQPFHVVPSESQRARMVSQTLVYNAIVLQLGSFKTEADEAYEAELEALAAQPTPTPDPNAEEGGDGTAATAESNQPEKPLPPDVITIIVSPQDAVTLNYAMMQNAVLTLAMRSARDEDIIQTEAVTLQYLLNQYNIPVPSKLPFTFDRRIDDLQLPVLTNDSLPEQTPETAP